MFERRPYFNNHLCYDSESYFRHRQLLEEQLMVKRHCQVPREKINGFYDIQAVNWNGLHTSGYLVQYDPRTGQSRAGALNGHTKRRSAIGANLDPGANFERVKQNTSAFGSLHLENVSQVYQSDGLQYSNEYNGYFVPSYNQSVKYVVKGAVSNKEYNNSIFREPGHYFQQKPYDRKKPQLREQGYIQTESHIPILKIATISSRPGSKSKKKYKQFLKVVNKCASEETQETKFSTSIIEEQLSCSPIFQMLSEIARAN